MGRSSLPSHLPPLRSPLFILFMHLLCRPIIHAITIHCVLLPLLQTHTGKLEFNENIQRETQLSRDGNEYIRVTYPKFKLGEDLEVVREVACPPTYGTMT